jgi:large subunit ribosomal protein L4
VETPAETAVSHEGADEPEVVVEDAKPELPKGAKAPLKSGGAPKGYEVKGNADSGLYHEPEGQWYDQTEAEFYFRTAEAAEAAGLTRAGGPAAEAADDVEEDEK